MPNFLHITVVAVFFSILSVRLVAQERTGVPVQQQNQQSSQERQSSTASRIDESQLVGLPLNGRSYNQLATLEAGVSDTSSASASRGLAGGGLNVSGGQSSSNVFLMDGTLIMGMRNQSPRSAAGTQLTSDSVLQVLVFGTNYSAEYGRGSGGILNSITRSGTPEFHGTFFEYLRNSKLDARNFFDGSEPPPFKRNQFGFTVTGPISKEQTYFMFGFEALRDRLSETDIGTFPDEEARVGRITDAEGNLLRTVSVNPEVVPYLKLFPIPNYERLGNGVAENRHPRFEPSDDEFFVLRVDHQFSLRDSMFVRYSFDDARSINGGSVYLFPGKNDSRQQYLTFVETHVFSTATINSLRLGYTRPTTQSRNVPRIDIPRDLLFISDSPDFGQINIPRVSGFGNGGGPSSERFNSFQVSDDVVLQRGAHAVKFGTQIHRYHTDTFTNANRGGVWSFNSLESFLRAPDGTEDKTTTLIGVLPDSDSTVHWRQTLLGVYINDSFKFRPNLQLDLGLRYEFSTLIHDLNGKSVFVADPLQDTDPTVGPYLDHNPSLRNLSPRLGVSWSPGTSGNTVFRTSYGIYYDQLLPYTMSPKKNTAPFFKKTVRTNFDHRPFFPKAEAALEGNPLQAQVVDYHDLTTPMVLRYGVEVQQELPGGWSTRLSYVGSRGNHLFRGYEFNLFPFPVIDPGGALFFPPQCNQLENPEARELELCRAYAGPMNPAFAGGLDITFSDGQSFYNSLRVSANKRLSSGTSFQFSYTLSKSVDDADEMGAQYPHFRNVDRALSDFDTRQQLSFNYFYPLPFGGGRPWLNYGVLSRLFGGWRIGGIVRYRTGTPFSPGMNVRKAGYLFETKRPNLQPAHGNKPATEGTTSGCGAIRTGEELGTARRFFDPCIYAFPEFGTLGNAGRNTITAPSVFSTDVSLQRDFGLGGDRRLQFRMEVFNPLNHTTLSGPRGSGSSVFSGAPSRINPSVGRISRTSTTSRQIQFALRFSF
ncbi:MAG: TonB-dependent receptor [Acidobacteria bacterium]|nr:TonB-dependent receptor [Acidobacteriota bacterium]